MRALGATYHSCNVVDVGFEPDVIMECTGVGQVIAESISVVGASGIVCLTGVGHGGTVPKIPTANVASSAVLKNNVVLGSVNANKRHWYKATEALARADRKWLSGLITRVGVIEGTVDAFRELRWKFRGPVFIGDTIHVTATVIETQPMRRLGNGMVVLEVAVVNQRGEVVQKGPWQALVRGRPAAD